MVINVLITLGAGMVFGNAIGNLVFAFKGKKFRDHSFAWLGLSIALLGFAF